MHVDGLKGSESLNHTIVFELPLKVGVVTFDHHYVAPPPPPPPSTHSERMIPADACESVTNFQAT